MSSNYRHILDECGRPVAPSSDIYQELSDLLEGAMSPKYIYTVILLNRYDIDDALLS